MTASGGAMTGVEKAAILLVLLGEETASRLLRHLPEDQLAVVAQQVAELGTIDAQLTHNILEEYFIEAVRPPVDSGGRDVAKRLLDQLDANTSLRKRVLGAEEEGASELLRPLLEVPFEALARGLQEEHPQTAALVLLHLPPHKAGRVLSELPEESRAETVLRMTTLRRVRGELVGEVISTLRNRIGDSLDPEDADSFDGMERTASMLLNVNRSAVRDLLTKLEERDAERAEQLRNSVFTFETMLLADDRGVQELLRLVDNKTLALALHGVDTALAEKFMSNLSQRAAGMLREEIEFLSAVRPTDQEAAQREIMGNALKLEEDEKLVFASPGAAEH